MMNDTPNLSADLEDDEFLTTFMTMILSDQLEQTNNCDNALKPCEAPFEDENVVKTI